MARISRPGRIPRVVNLEIKEAQIGALIQAQPQLLECAENLRLGGTERPAQPTYQIAPNFLAALQACVRTDARLEKLTAGAAQLGALGESADVGRRQEILTDRDTVGAQFLEDAIEQPPVNVAHGATPASCAPPHAIE